MHGIRGLSHGSCDAGKRGSVRGTQLDVTLRYGHSINFIEWGGIAVVLTLNETLGFGFLWLSLSLLPILREGTISFTTWVKLIKCIWGNQFWRWFLIFLATIINSTTSLSPSSPPSPNASVLLRCICYFYFFSFFSFFCFCFTWLGDWIKDRFE